MARKHGSGRKMGRYLRGNIDEVFPIAALATKDVIVLAMGGSVQERTLISSIVATWGMASMTPLADAGPVAFGVAHGDYQSAEIEAWIEDSGSWDEGNLISREIGKRKIRQIGVFETPDDPADAVVFNDGRPRKTKLNWILTQGVALNMWAYNTGTANLSGATGTDITVTGHANLWPK